MQNTSDQSIINKEKQIIMELVKISDASLINFSDLGWTSRVYIVGCGEIVFKFPRWQKVKEEYKIELEAYELVKKLKTDILFPEVVWKHAELEYIGYRGIVGRGMDMDIKSLSYDRKKNIGKQFGNFLRQLHKLDVENASTVTYEMEIEINKKKFQQCESYLKLNLEEREFNTIQDFVYIAYPTQIVAFGFDKIFCHGDFGLWNVINGKDNRVGIIDFGDAGYYDRAIDFAGMSDDVVSKSALHEYGDEPNLREKTQLRMKMMPIRDLPFFIGKNDELGIRKTVAKIKNNLPKYTG